MTFDEFEEANEESLRRETKVCFDKYNNPYTGGLDKPALLLEAQFYIQELGRREDSRIARRDFRMELIVILLIGLELVTAVLLAIWGSREQDRANQKQLSALVQMQGVLQNLNTSSQTTAATLSQLKAVTETMNGAIQKQVGLFYDVELNIVYEKNSKTLTVSNNGRTNVVIWGVKVDDREKEMMKEPQIIPPNGTYNFAFEAYQGFYSQTLVKNTSEDLAFLLFVANEKNERFTVRDTLTAVWRDETVTFMSHNNEIVPGWGKK
jgi:hypothetical protein